MNFKLNIYKDETLTEVEKVVEAERLKVPYRVLTYIAQSLDTLNINSEDDLFKFVLKSTDQIDKIIMATFGIKESELERVDVTELGKVAVELYKFGIEKINSMKGNDSKNVGATV